MKHRFKKPFLKDYFLNYCGEGPYEEQFKHYTDVKKCIRLVKNAGIPVRSIVVLGAASGQVLETLEKGLGVLPVGCEVSRWAHQRIPPRFREGVQLKDMRDYVPAFARRGAIFDLCFSNSLFYIPKSDIKGLIAALADTMRYLHFYPEPEGDPWVAIDEPYAWWQKKFAEFGFYRTKSPYLWKNHGNLL